MHRSLADNVSTPIHEALLTSSARQLTNEFSFPSWINQWIGHESNKVEREEDGILVRRHIGRGRALITAKIDRADSLSDTDFCQATRRIYTLICREARELSLPCPIRAWNWIPDIHRRSENGDRYMTFNLGRYEAMRDWFGDDLPARVPSASGVGTEGDALCVAALLSDQPGVPIENPRQIPAYRYSERFGRVPPCFARATRWNDLLFIAGTASVVGEESRHIGDFDRQLQVTLDHLKLMLKRGMDGDARFTSFRVYLPQQPLRSARIQAVREALRNLAGVTVEIVSAELCRAELLVEIEATGQRK